jgi:GT2 family glycosyltransferase
VSVVIPTYNGLELLRTCLNSLSEAGGRGLEVVVVDNASTDGTAEHVKEHFPRVEVVRLPRNAGFSGGTNAGIARSRGDYIFFLNNDAAVTPGAVDELIAFMEGHPEAGMVGPMVVDYDDAGRVDNLGLATYRDGTTWGLARGEPAVGRGEAHEVLFPCGCACLCRREVLECVGGFDEDFHMLMEDADLGWRVRLAGWACYCVPTAVVRHRYSATIGRFSPDKAFYVERNRIWLAVKNFPLRLLWKSPYYSAVRYAYQAAGVWHGEGPSSAFYRTYGAAALAGTLLSAYASALLGLPAMLRKRRSQAAQRAVSTREVVGWLDRFGIGARDLAWGR